MSARGKKRRGYRKGRGGEREQTKAPEPENMIKWVSNTRRRATDLKRLFFTSIYSTASLKKKN